MQIKGVIMTTMFHFSFYPSHRFFINFGNIPTRKKESVRQKERSTLRGISESGMEVAELLSILLAQSDNPVVPLSLAPLLVLDPAVRGGGKRSRNQDGSNGEIDFMAVQYSGASLGMYVQVATRPPQLPSATAEAEEMARTMGPAELSTDQVMKRGEDVKEPVARKMPRYFTPLRPTPRRSAKPATTQGVTNMRTAPRERRRSETVVPMMQTMEPKT